MNYMTYLLKYQQLKSKLLAHLLTHGVFHLQGYDHLTDKQAKEMESKEIKILKKLGYKNPYADEEFVCDNKSCCPGRFITKLESLRLNSFWRFVITALFGVIAAFGFAPFHLWLLSLLGIGGMYYFTVKQTKKISFWKSWLFAFPFGAA